MFVFKFTVIVLKQASRNVICKRLASNEVRVRFAPSPTGYLHLGGLRTALYNHLFAKSHNGVSILRIEDTDLSRRIPEAAENLVHDLAWCGITYDEGPYFQSERKEIYQKYAQQLVDQGDAYYCFCSNTRLDLLRKEALKAREVPKYDNCCRSLSKEEVENFLKAGKPAVIRFKLSSYKAAVNDLIYGPKSYDVAAEEGDPIILKTDGFPTYHLANVVDDHLMNITHVLRGMEWLKSTTKHILLYRAFKWDPPQFGHIPLLLNMDGTKLSKRQGDCHVKKFKEMGFLPDALINFVIHFGGGFDVQTEKELKIYSLDELTKMFELSRIKSSSCRTDLSLLPAYNRAAILKLLDTEHGRQELIKKTQELIQNHFKDSKYENTLQLDDQHVEHIIRSMRNRIELLETLVSEDFSYLWVWENKWDETNETVREMIKNLAISIESINWTEDDLNKFFKTFSKRYSDIKYSDLMHTLRIVLTGSKVGAGVAEIMTTLSKEDVLFRLTKASESNTPKATG